MSVFLNLPLLLVSETQSLQALAHFRFEIAMKASSLQFSNSEINSDLSMKISKYVFKIEADLAIAK